MFGKNITDDIRKLFIALTIVLMIGGLIIKASNESVNSVHKRIDSLIYTQIPDLTVIADLQNISNSLNVDLHSYFVSIDRNYYDNLAGLIEDFRKNLTKTGFSNNYPRLIDEILWNLDAFENRARLFDKEMNKAEPRDMDALRNHLYMAEAYSAVIIDKLFQISVDIRNRVQDDSNNAKNESENLKIKVYVLIFAVIVVSIYIILILYLRNKYQSALYNHAFYNQLTGLPNRSYFMEKYSGNLSEHKPDYFALLLINLDRFELINGLFGYQTGDQLLLIVTKWIENTLARHNVNSEIYQYSTSKWLIVLPDTHKQQEIIAVIEALLLIHYDHLHVGERELCCSFSIGACQYPAHASELDKLLHHADSALKACDDTRSDYCFYTEQMHEVTIENIELLQSLRRAMIAHDFELHWQPKYRADTAQPCSAEVLLRWKKDDQYISPAHFIPLAEESGLILEIGHWVLEQSCRQWLEWKQQGMPSLPIAVNVSAVQFTDKDFVAQVKLLLDELGMPANMLELEITEQAVVSDPKHVIKNLNELRSLGLSLAIDDFGTGYSSLSYLSQFPINTLKIDRAFITSMDDNASSNQIVKLILGLAKQLHCKTVAEGVETSAQHRLLRDWGCDYIQGYLFSKPLGTDDYAKLLAKYEDPEQKKVAQL